MQGTIPSTAISLYLAKLGLRCFVMMFSSQLSDSFVFSFSTVFLSSSFAGPQQVSPGPQQPPVLVMDSHIVEKKPFFFFSFSILVISCFQIRSLLRVFALECSKKVKTRSNKKNSSSNSYSNLGFLGLNSRRAKGYSQHNRS